jgi:histidinol-phosphate aminotransferase
MQIESLIRANILQLKPYRSARQDYIEGILLDANENAFGCPIDAEGLPLNRYPDPYQQPLRKKLAELNGVRDENVFVGAGSDEAIDLLFRIFCEPASDSILSAEPTYGMYRVSANIHNVSVISSLLTPEFQLDVGDILAKVNRNIKLIFCCSPNNPTANLLRGEDIRLICESVTAVVVVDEAYIEFSGAESLSMYVQSYPNLVVLRTLSKAWGLAGIRLGYCIADPTIIGYLMKVKAPYNVNLLSSHFALTVLQNPKSMQSSVSAIITERKRLTEALSSFKNVKNVYPSDANFLLVRFTESKQVFSELIRRGIIVRDRSGEPGLANCLRITVGTPEQNTILLNALEEIDV